MGLLLGDGFCCIVFVVRVIGWGMVLFGVVCCYTVRVGFRGCVLGLVIGGVTLLLG